MSERLKPGWLRRVMCESAIETACWSPTMRESAGINTKRLTKAQRAEAVARLRRWADELETEDAATGRKE